MESIMKYLMLILFASFVTLEAFAKLPKNNPWVKRDQEYFQDGLPVTIDDIALGTEWKCMGLMATRGSSGGRRSYYTFKQESDGKITVSSRKNKTTPGHFVLSPSGMYKIARSNKKKIRVSQTFRVLSECRKEKRKCLAFEFALNDEDTNGYYRNGRAIPSYRPGYWVIMYGLCLVGSY